MNSRHGFGNCPDYSNERRREIFDTYMELRGKMPQYKIANKLDLNPAYLSTVKKKKWFQELASNN